MVDHAPAMPAAAVAPLREGGVLSVMAVNRHSAPLVAAVRGLGPAAAPAALDRDRADGRTFGTTMALYTAEEIASLPDGLGCPRADRYGIRSVCDHIADDERKHDPAFHADLERLEPAVTDRPAHRHTARLYQLAARRGTAACAPPRPRRGVTGDAGSGQGRVRTRGPSSVTATVCSMWAARLPSVVRSVQPSASVR
ncbi:hypothetical protein [Streptomyces sp. DH37]|uniref:hypothetical protein n=1 Tax=Streptomyces sp. DH37 TaxID=3040122 RepID=UPI002442741C|nr:hypothetical protein [Streptomyces sp. DH37]MDG9705695.1 hypothetical protein [Streptomyces sp. DH37]